MARIDTGDVVCYFGTEDEDVNWGRYFIVQDIHQEWNDEITVTLATREAPWRPHLAHVPTSQIVKV